MFYTTELFLNFNYKSVQNTSLRVGFGSNAQNTEAMQGNIASMQGNMEAMQGNIEAMQGNIEAILKNQENQLLTGAFFQLTYGLIHTHYDSVCLMIAFIPTSGDERYFYLNVAEV